MSAHLNKTELTLRVTEAAAQWLANIGCKCIEAEVSVAAGWLADLAGLWSPTRTEAQKHKLIPKTPQWTRAGTPEQQSYQFRHQQREAAFDALPPIITVALEVKTTKADFRGDEKWNRELPADICILAMPRQLIPSTDWPERWWVLLHNEAGGVVTIAKRAPLGVVSDAQRLWVASSLAERRHNRTAYAMWRDLHASHRDNENERISRARIDHAVAAVVTYVQHPEMSFDDCLGRHLPGQVGKAKIPHWLAEQLEALRRPSESAALAFLNQHTKSPHT